VLFLSLTSLATLCCILGGWDANAANNCLNKRLPDTLNVWVNDSSNGAKAINNHLRRDMEIEFLDYQEKLSKMKNEEEKSQLRVPSDYLAIPQLVDLEQGWRSIHHIRLGKSLFFCFVLLLISCFFSFV
jgi:isocitrate lyase